MGGPVAALAFVLTALTSQGERLRCVADTGLCLHPGEVFVNQGGKPALRLKGIEHLVLMDFDVAPLKGRTVEEARLFLRPVAEHKLRRIGLSTVASAWAEGTGNGDARPGEPCFKEAARGGRPWAYPGSDFHAVSFGEGGSIWFVRELRPEADGWISVEVPPAILHAMAEGKSHGMVVSDESGQTTANNDVYAREQSSSQPYIQIKRIHPGPPSPSGAKLYSDVAPPEKKVADRAAEFLPPYVPAAARGPATLPDGCLLRILHEGRPGPDAEPAGRLWDGRSVSLAAARGEHVGFLVALAIPEGRPRTVSFTGDGWSVSRVLPVGSGFDPLVPVAGEVSGKSLFHVERYVAKTAAPGESKLSLKVSTGEAEITIPVALKVHSAVLPDALSFHVSLNAYGSPADWSGEGGDPVAMERAAHRLAHEHRATIAIVPYSHRGNIIAGMAPEIRREGARVHIVSWRTWDDRFGPLLDGSAFKGLPRDGVPIDHLYLPVHEQWPLPINEFYSYRGAIQDHWKHSLPIEESFPDAYAQAFVKIVRDFGTHFAEKGWTKTDYQIYLNNKNYIRYGRGETEGSWWCLDEPVFFDDFAAIRFFARLCRTAQKDVPGVPLRFRIDLSRPQWRRGLLDGLIDLNAVSGMYREYPRFVFGKQGEDVWSYSGFASPETAPESGRAWILQLFLDGADGAVPWLALGTPKAWSEPEDTAIILPPREGLEQRPYATLRLKLARRGQQDVELLRLLLARRKWAREELRLGVAAYLGLSGAFRQTSTEDAGQVDFDALDPDRFESYRRAVLDALDR
jgi:hypothetical protein